MTPDRLSEIYPTPRVNGKRVTRLPEKPLGWAILDAATADKMGREQLGWFVGNHSRHVRVAAQLGRLDTNPQGGVWVVVTLDRVMSRELFDKWPHTDYVIERPRSNIFTWRSRKVWVAASEDLKQLLPFARAFTPGLAGLIVLDPECIMYKARGWNRWGRTIHNDLPQHVVNFRAALDEDGWQPPLLLLTTKPAGAVYTESVARAFCLNGFWFVAGDSFCCWDVPIE
jgi:hypothetical protein